MIAFVRWLLRRPAWAAAACGVLTVLALASLSRVMLATSLGSLLLGDTPEYQHYLQRAEQFGGNDVFLIGLETEGFATGETRERLQRIVRGLEGVNYVERVGSVLPYLRLKERLQGEGGSGVDQLLADPLVSGTLVSSDGRSTVLVVELESAYPIESAASIVEEAVGVCLAEGFQPHEVHATGLVCVLGEIAHQTELNLLRSSPLVAVILVVCVWLLFRRWWAAAIAFFVAALAVVWTMGVAIAVDRSLNVIVALAPAVVFILAFSEAVHLCNAYLLELGRGLQKRDAIVTSVAKVGRACVYTTITTLAGFGSLIFTPSPAFRLLGMVLSVGVAASFVANMTVVPLCLTLTSGRLSARRERGPNAVDWLLARCRQWVVARPWATIAGFVVVAALGAAAASRLRFQTDLYARLHPENRISADLAWFESRLGGVNSLDVFVEGPEEGALLEPEFVAALARAQEEVARHPRVEKVVSVVDVLSSVRRAVAEPGEPPAWADDESLWESLVLARLGAGDFLDSLIDSEVRTARMNVRLRGNEVRSTYETGREVGASVAERMGPAATVEVSGMSFLMGGWLESLLAGQRTGLWLAIGIVSAIMIVCFGSLRCGFWATVPNLLPLVVVGAIAALAWGAVDSDSLVVGILAVGLTENDTIHLVLRYRFERERGAEPTEALEHAYSYSGRAILIASTLLIAGFLPFAASDYLSIQMLGILLPITIVGSLAVVLLLIPALIRVGLIRFAPNASALASRAP